jgi:hypothetical protein
MADWLCLKLAMRITYAAIDFLPENHGFLANTPEISFASESKIFWERKKTTGK